MKKEQVDFIFVLSMFSFFILSRAFFIPDFTFPQAFTSLIPLIIIGYFGLFHANRVILNFFVTFICFFILFHMKPWLIYWTNLHITGGLAALCAAIFTFIFKQTEQKRDKDPLNGTVIRSLLNKFPQMSYTLLFIIDTLITSLFIGGTFMLIIRDFHISYVIGVLLIISYFSASAIYFYLHVPEKTRKRKRKLK
ncbi:MAG: hypothetical protein RSC33_01080 [Vagococcus sp.]